MESTGRLFDVYSVRDLLTTVFKHKWKIVIVASIVFTVALLVAFGQQQTYEAKGLLLVKYGREFWQRPEEGARSGSGLSIPLQTIVGSEMTILRSHDLARRVVSAIGPEVLYPLKEERGKRTVEHTVESAARDFEKHLMIGNPGGTNFVEVTFEHNDPKRATIAVNTLMDLFKEKHVEVYSGEGTDFLEKQVKAFRDKLQQSESDLSAFKQRHRIVAIDQQKLQVLSEIGSLRTELRSAQSEAAELQQKIAFVGSGQGVTDLSTDGNAYRSLLQQQLITLQAREREYQQKYTNQSAVMTNLRHEIEEIRDEIANSGKQDLEKRRRMELASLDNQLATARRKADRAGRQIERAEGEVLALESRTRELDDLKRRTVEDEQNYQVYVRKLEDAHIMDDMDRRKMIAISLVERATIPLLPKKQKFGKEKLIPLGILGGVGAGLALAFLLEFIGPGMTTPLSAERRLDLPVMVAIRKKG